MNYYLTDFKVEHIERMNEHEQIALVQVMKPDAFKYMEHQGHSFTLMRDDEPIGCGGINRLWDGARVGEAWVALIAPARACPLRVVRLCRNGIEQIRQRGNFERAQGAIVESDQRAMRFAQFLGFEVEGLMRKFSHGLNYYRVAKIWD